MTLKEFLEVHKQAWVAAELGVTPQCISRWHCQRICPRPEQMKALLKLSKGKLSYESIIEPYLKNRGK
jgi:hypothetical protein